MFEILVGFIALVVLYRIFPGKRNGTESKETILPFLEDEFLKDKNQPEGEYYDWADDVEDGFVSADEDSFGDAGDELFE